MRAFGVGAFYLTLEKASYKPEKPDEDITSTEEWNELMLEYALWEGINSWFLGYIRHTIASERLQDAIEEFTLVADALGMLDLGCDVPRPGIDAAYYGFQLLQSCSLDKAPSFSHFHVEFERRFEDFNSLGLFGGFELDENLNCILFLNALGTRFTSWVAEKSQMFKVAGYATGSESREMGFLELRQQAESKWASINSFPESDRRHLKADSRASQYVNHESPARMNDDNDMWRSYRQDDKRQQFKTQQKQQRKMERKQRKLDERARNANQGGPSRTAPQQPVIRQFPIIPKAQSPPSPPRTLVANQPTSIGIFSGFAMRCEY